MPILTIWDCDHINLVRMLHKLQHIFFVFDNFNNYCETDFFFVVRLWLGTSSHYPNQPSYNSKAGREGGALQGKSLPCRLNTFESSSFGNFGT